MTKPTKACKMPFEETEQVSDLDSERADMLEMSDW